MTVRAEGTHEQRGDLLFVASIKGAKSPTITIERKYEQSTSLTKQSSQPSSVKSELPPSMKSQPPRKSSTESEQPKKPPRQPKKPSIKQSNSSEIPRQSSSQQISCTPPQESQPADNNG